MFDLLSHTFPDKVCLNRLGLVHIDNEVPPDLKLSQIGKMFLVSVYLHVLECNLAIIVILKGQAFQIPFKYVLCATRWAFCWHHNGH
jgi:hypothetical protein